MLKCNYNLTVVGSLLAVCDMCFKLFRQHVVQGKSSASDHNLWYSWWRWTVSLFKTTILHHIHWTVICVLFCVIWLIVKTSKDCLMLQGLQRDMKSKSNWWTVDITDISVQVKTKSLFSTLAVFSLCSISLTVKQQSWTALTITVFSFA